MIIKDEVRKAIDSLKAKGTEPTPANLREVLGGRGSYSTISKYRDEILEETSPVADTEEHRRAFEKIWGEAYDRGRMAGDAVCGELRAGNEGKLAEIHRLEGCNTALEIRISELENQRAEATAQEAAAKDLLLRARADAKEDSEKRAEALAKLAAAQESHAAEAATLRTRLEAAEAKAHGLAIELARAEGRLETRFERSKKAASKNERHGQENALFRTETAPVAA